MGSIHMVKNDNKWHATKDLHCTSQYQQPPTYICIRWSSRESSHHNAQHAKKKKKYPVSIPCISSRMLSRTHPRIYTVRTPNQYPPQQTIQIDTTHNTALNNTQRTIPSIDRCSKHTAETSSSHILQQWCHTTWVYTSTPVLENNSTAQHATTISASNPSTSALLTHGATTQLLRQTTAPLHKAVCV